MARFLPSLALAGLTIAAAACGPETNRITPVSNPSLYSVHQPVVERTHYVFDVRGGYGGLSPDERVRLDDWFGSLGLRYGDRVSVDAERSASVRNDVADVAGSYGVLLSDGAPAMAGAPAGVRVIVTRAQASVPGCPLWEDELVGTPERTGTNYGCATASNLANMIADPHDLVRGRGADALTGPDQATPPIKAYRARESATK